MNIQAINTTYRCRDGYKQIVNAYKLQNGNTLRVITEYRKGVKETSMQYLTDSMGAWIKSKLRYFDKNGKCTKTIKSNKK